MLIINKVFRYTDDQFDFNNELYMNIYILAYQKICLPSIIFSKSYLKINLVTTASFIT